MKLPAEVLKPTARGAKEDANVGTGHYDRQGNEIGADEWAKSYTTANKRVDETTLPDGRWISTVWLGLDHQYGDGPPLIFETMVFPSKDGPLHELYCERYSTEAEAKEGHERIVEECKAGQHAIEGAPS